MLTETNLYISLITVLLWLGLWGISDSVINSYIPYDDNKTRILLYIIIVLIGVCLYIYITKYHPSKEQKMLSLILIEQEKLKSSVNEIFKKTNNKYINSKDPNEL